MNNFIYSREVRRNFYHINSAPGMDNICKTFNFGQKLLFIFPVAFLGGKENKEFIENSLIYNSLRAATRLSTSVFCTCIALHNLVISALGKI